MGFLTLLKFAPSILSAGRQIVESFTGESLSEDTSAKDVSDRLEAMPEKDRLAAMAQLTEAKVKLQTLDTQRFLAMNGNADKMRASARPEIALRAMAVIETYSKVFKGLMAGTGLEWAARMVCAGLDIEYPEISLWALIAKAEPVTSMIWPPLLASFWVCAEIIKKYMGVRERDKAQEYEIQNGRPLKSTAATVAAAGGGLANIIKAFKG